jgi:hypothetical protein
MTLDELINMPPVYYCWRLTSSLNYSNLFNKMFSHNDWRTTVVNYSQCDWTSIDYFIYLLFASFSYNIASLYKATHVKTIYTIV